MTTRILLQLVLGSAVFLGGVFHPGTHAQDPTPTPSPETREDPAEDKIHSAKEVDVKAKVKRVLDNPPKPGADCQGRMRLLVGLRAVLRKSGKVTDTEVLKESGCNSYDQDAIRAVRNLKFDPARKDNRPVSQYMVFEFQFSRF